MPHGVTPPAQFRTVPASVDHTDSHRPQPGVEDHVRRAARAVAQIGDAGPGWRRTVRPWPVRGCEPGSGDRIFCDAGAAIVRSWSSSSVSLSCGTNAPSRRCALANSAKGTGISSIDRHAVVQARTPDAIRHQVAGPAVGPVAEPVRQLKQWQPGGFVHLRSDITVRARDREGGAILRRAESSCSESAHNAPAPIAPRRRNVRRSVLVSSIDTAPSRPQDIRQPGFENDRPAGVAGHRVS